MVLPNKYELFFFDSENFNDHDVDDFMQYFISFNEITTKSNDPEHELLKPLFNWMPLDIIKKTFQMSN